MNRKKLLKNKFLNFLTLKNILLTGSVVAIATVPIPIAVSCAMNNQTFNIYGESFDNINSAANYIKNNSVEAKQEYWTIEYNNSKKVFNTPEELRAFVLDKFIYQEQYITNENLNNFKDPLTNSLKSEFWQHVSKYNPQDPQSTNLTKVIYQGFKNEIFENLDSAVDSYFEVHDAYFFNNIYFNSKNDLKNYLVTTYLPSNNEKVNSIVLKGPNGIVSTPIDLLNPVGAAQSIDSFIKNNALKVVKYKNSKTNEYINITNSNVNDVLHKINIEDLSYVHMQSNQGESRYVIDNYDNSNLIGPYFYNGILDVGSFKNKNMWKKVNNISKQVYMNSKIDAMIGSFFSSVIVDDNVLNVYESEVEKKDIPIFRTSLIAKSAEQNNGKELTLDDWFMMELKQLSPRLYNELSHINFELMKGNKYNTFFKIPIMYSFIMQRVVSWGLSQITMDVVNFYFEKVCDYIQDAIEVVLMDESLLVRRKDSKKFNVKDLFRIGDGEYNLNTSVEYFLAEIKTYPRLIAAMDAYLGAANNMFMTGGLIPFVSFNQNYLIENKIITESEYYNIYEKLAVVYTTYSQTDYANLLAWYIPNSTNPEVKKIASMPTDKWDEALDNLKAKYSVTTMGIILKSVGSKNSYHHNLARTILNNEIRIFINSGAHLMKGGYLEQIYNDNPELSKLDLFIKYVTENENVDAYKAYMVFLIDVKMNLRIIDSQSVANPINFAMALTRVITYGLGTAYLAGSTINSIYKSGRYSVSSSVVNNYGSSNDTLSSGRSEYSFPSTSSHPIWDLIDSSSISSVNTIGSSLENGSMSGTIGSGGSSIIGPSDSIIVRSKVNNISQTRGKNDEGLWYADLKFLQNGINDAIGKVPVSRIDFTVYANQNLFRRANKSSFSSGINEIKNNFAWLSEYGMDIDFATTSGHRVPINVDPNVSIGGLLDGDLSNIRYSFNNTPSVPVGKDGNGSVKSLSIKSGVSADKIFPNEPDYLSLVFPMDELDAIDNASFTRRSVSINSEISLPSTSSIGSPPSTPPPPPPGRPNKPTPTHQTTFTYSFRKRISASKVADWTNRSWEKMKKIGSFTKKIMTPLISTGITALEIFFLVYSLIEVQYIKDLYVYTTSDGTEFIWDGGVTVSKFMGLDVQQMHGIEGMRLIDPVQITLPQIEEFYYYNGIKYYNTSELKKDQVNYMVQNGYSGVNKNFNLRYTLHSLNDIYADSYPTINELIANVYKDLNIIVTENNGENQYDFSKINQQSQYLSSSSYAFADSVVSSSNDNVTKANQIASKIRKTKIALLPELDENGKTNGSKKDFVYPGMYYELGAIKENKDLSMKYIIDNSANMTVSKSSNQYITTNEIEADLLANKKIKEMFIEQVKPTISSKNVLVTDVIKTDSFNTLNSNWIVTNLYVVRLNKEIRYFISREEANNYVYKKLGFEKNFKKVYEYKDIRFENIESLKKFLKKNNNIN